MTNTHRTSFTRRRAAQLAVLAFCTSIASAQSWAGKWYTTEGIVVLEADGASIEGKYGDNNAGSIAGKAKGKKLAFTYEIGRGGGTGEFELDSSGHAFTGSYSRTSGGGGSWSGWRKNPNAKKGRAAKFGGAWRTSWGLLELTQTGKKVKGDIGAQGWSKVTGAVEGRRLTFRYTAPYGGGEVWAEMQKDGKAAFGAVKSDRGGEWKWIARRLEGFAKKIKPKPETIVQGLSSNRMTYYVRAPKGWKPRASTPAIVFFHGSNMSAQPYVNSIATRKALADRYMIIGIDGERWEDGSKPDNPRHNYTYVNWMGKSTYEGYPNTHRESPALVAELITDLKKQLKLDRVFVGGHSQGGFLSYFLLMHYPELVDGVFPMSSGVTMQCEPNVFDDAKLKAAQRATPLAVVHAENDPVVAFSQGQGAFHSFLEQGFPQTRLFTNNGAHMFLHLPFEQAIDWLAGMSEDDPDEMLAFGLARLDDDAFRDVTAIVGRLRSMKLGRAQAAKTQKLAAAVDDYCKEDAVRFTEEITTNQDGSWADGFLEFRESFEFADAAKPAMAAYQRLREKHEEPADELIGEARKLFQAGDRDAGYEKYEELLEKYYASSSYRRVKGWVASRR